MAREVACGSRIALLAGQLWHKLRAVHLAKPVAVRVGGGFSGAVPDCTAVKRETPIVVRVAPPEALISV